jgi:hypothetical protein
MRGVSNGGITTTVPIASATNAGVRWDKTSAGKLFDALREDQPPPASVVGR